MNPEYQNMTLVQLWDKYGRAKYITDKGDGHSYLPVYDELFERFKHDRCNLLEIGHSAGGALRLFDDYFTHPRTRIVGIDQSDNDWLIMYSGKPYETDRVETYLYDVHNLTVNWFYELNFLPDIIIEDSNHQLQTQLFVVRELLPLINDNGLLIIEDVLDPQQRFPEFQKVQEATLISAACKLIDLNPIQNTRDNALIVFYA
jgi:hypothetical protein